MGLQRRHCACPNPSHGGEDCRPPKHASFMASLEAKKINNELEIPVPSTFALESIKTGQGRWVPCNRHPCPYLPFLNTDEEKFLLNDLLAQRAEETWAYSGGVPAHLNDPMRLSCPETRESRKEVFDKLGRFPKAKAYWTKDIPVSPHAPHDTPPKPLENKANLLIEGDQLTIRQLTPNETGIYRYGYEYDPGYFETVCFHVVYIKQLVWVSNTSCRSLKNELNNH